MVTPKALVAASRKKAKARKASRKKKAKPIDLDKVMAGLPTRTKLEYCQFEASGKKTKWGAEVPKRMVLVLSFAEVGFGFGEVTIMTDKKGQVYIDGETMSREHVKVILSRLVDDAIMDREDDPKKHRAYDRVMKRYCGDPNCPSKRKRSKSK